MILKEKNKIKDTEHIIKTIDFQRDEFENELNQMIFNKKKFVDLIDSSIIAQSVISAQVRHSSTH